MLRFLAVINAVFNLEDYYIVLELEQFNNIIARHTIRAAMHTAHQVWCAGHWWEIIED
jgi:hypothetical protein